MLIEDLNQLIVSIKVDFYQRLIEGEIEKAKESLFFIVGYAYDFQNKWLNEKRDITNVDINKINDANNIITELCNKINELNILSKKDLQNLRNKEFTEDPKNWKVLLTEEFESIVNKILELIDVTKENILAIEKEKQQKRILIQYTKQYIEFKTSRSSDEQEIINKTEEKIRIYLEKKIYMKGITDKILTGPWKGYLHSQLSGKLGYYRIIYSYEKNTLKFIIIGTKKELGIN